MFMLNWIVSVVIYFGTWIENNEVDASKGCSGLGPNKWQDSFNQNHYFQKYQIDK